MPTLTATVRTIIPGLAKVVYIPTIAATTLIPTRAEITAGTILQHELVDWNGWAVEGAVVENKSVGTRNVAGVAGMKTLTESSLTFHGDKTGADARVLLVDGLLGYIAFMDGGDVPTQPMDVFKTEVVATAKIRPADGSALYGLMVKFAVIAWALDVDIPAAS